MQKHRIGVRVEKNSYVDSGDGLITFPMGQVITDTSKQRNGTIYDIKSMDLTEYKGQITADHVDGLENYIGEALGLAKRGDEAVTISGIRFAVTQTALGRIAYDLMAGGFPLDLSTETYGPWPDESDDTYYNARLVGLSVVIVGNNKSATMGKAAKALAMNSLAQAKEDGLDTSDAEKLVEAEPPVVPAPAKDEPNGTDPVPPVEVIPPVPAPIPPKKEPAQPTKQERNSMFKTIKNTRDFAVPVTYKNAAGDEVKTDLAAGATLDVAEDQVEAVEKQINSAQAPAPDFSKAMADVLAPILEKIDQIEKNAFDKGAVEPSFEPAKNAAPKGSGTADLDKEFAAMDYRERHALQIGLAWDALKGNDRDAMDKLVRVNKFNLGKLKSEGVVQNSLSIGDFGNFVISQELLTEIQGIRTDFAPLVTATQWTETLSTQMAWLSRQGDINMQPVEFLDDTVNGTWPNGNLKPLSNYGATIQTANLEELAAVTPVMTAATRFMAADLLSDIAAGYRNDYDRKRAQLVIARLQQAVNQNGNSLPYNVHSNVEGLTDFLDLWTRIGEKTPNGTYILGTSTLSELTKRALSAGTNGPLATLFTQGRDGVNLIFGKPYIVVSDELLPRLNSNDSVSFAVSGQNVPITQSVFYANLSNFTGRTSGGLNYDLSMEAAYEDQGVVKSAFQRNEMVLRGSFFRGGAIKDVQQVASLGSAGIS